MSKQKLKNTKLKTSNPAIKLAENNFNKFNSSKAKELTYKDTSEIQVPKKISDQIIGQEEGLRIIKKASLQRRHVLLIGEPGTGKSLMGQALAELLPAAKLTDIIALPNDQDENNPLIRVMPKGKGKELVNKIKLKNNDSFKNQNIIFFILIAISVISPWWIRKQYGDILAAASLIGSMIFLGIFVLFINLNRRMGVNKLKSPKLIVDNSDKKNAPFIDGTGMHAGALLGDCLHDPLQSIFTTMKLQQINKFKNSHQIQIQEVNLKNLVDKSINKHNYEIIRNENGYEATFLDKGELSIICEKENKIIDSSVLSVNRYHKKGSLIKLTTKYGKELIVTQEHKVAVKNFLNKIKYIRADKIKPWHKLITLN